MKNYFATKELLPKHVWMALGEAGRFLVHPDLLEDMNLLRDDIGKKYPDLRTPFIVNDHVNFNWRCVRTDDWEHFSSTSRHSLNRKDKDARCCAIDFHCPTVPIKRLHAHIIEGVLAGRYLNFEFLEVDINWVHVDTDDRDRGDPLAIWSPSRGYIPLGDYIVELALEGHINANRTPEALALMEVRDEDWNEF